MHAPGARASSRAGRRGLASRGATPPSRRGGAVPSLEDLVARRDFKGALAVTEFQRRSAKPSERRKWAAWAGYCAVRLGDFARAQAAYAEAAASEGAEPVDALCESVCLFYLGRYEEAEAAAQRGGEEPLKQRLLFHIAHRLGDEEKLMAAHQKLHGDSTYDQLSLAAIHYLRGHFQEATDIYKRLLVESRESLALNVYVSMCYHKLDYYDVSNEILSAYLHRHPDSAAAVNVRACNQYRLFNGAAALQELRRLDGKDPSLLASDLLVHNQVVFRDGAGAPQKLPMLLDSVHEARLNLIIYHLKLGARAGLVLDPEEERPKAARDHVMDAWALVEELQPLSPSEFTLKAVVLAALGQRPGGRERLQTARDYFEVVGSSPAECDTIPGRQCMASYYFLSGDFEDASVYLHSITSYMQDSPEFHWNYGLALARCGKWKEAEEHLERVDGAAYRGTYAYQSHMARCHIANGHPEGAWELYCANESAFESSLLDLIANDAYRAGHFYWAAKAFAVLERASPGDPVYREAKRGAAVGVFQKLIAGEATEQQLGEVLRMLQAQDEPQAQHIVTTINKWCLRSNVTPSILGLVDP